MAGVPKWIDDLIWCGKPVDPAKIEYPQDPPGVLGPNTIRSWQRMMAPINAANHYTPIKIEFSEADWQIVRRHLAAVTEALPPNLDGRPNLIGDLGMKMGPNALLPPGFVTLHFVGGRIELAKLTDGPSKPTPPKPMNPFFNNDMLS